MSDEEIKRVARIAKNIPELMSRHGCEHLFCAYLTKLNGIVPMLEDYLAQENRDPTLEAAALLALDKLRPALDELSRLAELRIIE